MGGGAAVAGAGESDPGFELAGGGVDDGEAWLVPVGGEEELVVVGDGDALDADFASGGSRAFDGYDGEGFVGVEVEYGDGARADVGGVGEAAVVGEGEHMRLRLAGGDLVENLKGFGVDGCDGLVEFGGDVEEIAVGVVDGEVGADAVAEVQGRGDVAGGDIDDEHLVAVGAWAANACVAVDGKVSGAAIGGGSDFMSGDAVFLECEGLLPGGGIDEGESVVGLVGDEDRS